jgi:hypothetical protein
VQEFIVLGIIPGTSIQITFIIWLILVGCIMGMIATSIIRRRRLITVLLISLVIRTHFRIPTYVHTAR